MGDEENLVSNLLPERARRVLVAASNEAKKHPQDSIKRKQIIEEAIIKAKEIAPGCFANSRSETS